VPLLAEEIFWSIQDWEHVTRVLVRLLVAAALGALVGIQRGFEGKEAGARTHMLVAVGSALFIIVGKESGMTSNDISRVVQGIITGIGFLGAGQILKLSVEHHVRGLTTAASIWVTCGVGVAVGFGALWPAVMGIVLAFLILTVLGYLEHRMNLTRAAQDQQQSPPPPQRSSTPDAGAPED
jgi:putative Mg2+ transporter-C (MgtC) family protein